MHYLWVTSPVLTLNLSFECFALWPSLTLNSRQSSCFCLLSVRIASMCHHVLQDFLFKKETTLFNFYNVNNWLKSRQTLQWSQSLQLLAETGGLSVPHLRKKKQKLKRLQGWSCSLWKVATAAGWPLGTSAMSPGCHRGMYSPDIWQKQQRWGKISSDQALSLDLTQLFPQAHLCARWITLTSVAKGRTFCLLARTWNGIGVIARREMSSLTRFEEQACQTTKNP